MPTVRVKPGVEAAVFDSATQTYVGLAPGREFDASDPVVLEHPWAFESKEREVVRPIAARVEEMTAVPGAKRNR